MYFAFFSRTRAARHMLFIDLGFSKQVPQLLFLVKSSHGIQNGQIRQYMMLVWLGIYISGISLKFRFQQYLIDPETPSIRQVIYIYIYRKEGIYNTYFAIPESFCGIVVKVVYNNSHVIYVRSCVQFLLDANSQCNILLEITFKSILLKSQYNSTGFQLQFLRI